MVEFKTLDNEKLNGIIVKQYKSFEGDIRYIIQTIDNRQYRCNMNEEGEYYEISF